MITLAQAKDLLRIHEIWRQLDLPGDPKTSCKCPWREDRHASLSISPDGRLFNDFVTGQGGDAIDFLQLATGFSRQETCSRFREMAGDFGSTESTAIKIRALPPSRREKPILPALRRDTTTELEALANLRHLSLPACLLGDSVGLLRFAVWRGLPTWIVTDEDGLNAQARRMDGKNWDGIETKALTLPGCWARWPLGIRTAADYPNIALVEGGPDLLAGLHFIHAEGRESDCFPIAMLGAWQRVHEDALEIFLGKRVRIFAHDDESGVGKAAAERWAGQLAGCDVGIADFSGLRKANGEPIKDLNDCTQISANDVSQLEGLLPE